MPAAEKLINKKRYKGEANKVYTTFSETIVGGDFFIPMIRK